ncbi:phosphodiester glycosidase family protein [Chryseobacterium antibioticum]|uniref:Phosphodiester glycosidase family protein n=1 Tax=Chryseobacterium pyrolae TaxID=2987481 RepID=A0ABT2IG63_9FLAO|nr:phosphodiester glycosidase family protein [Chryseobacterium pyrolae]MCT2407552.1 phosphodiester glycosidase family protein [Chryseobacterium pyrolae]
MKLNILSKILFISVFVVFFSCKEDRQINPDFVVYSVDTKNEKVEFFWKNTQNQPFRNIQNLKKYVRTKNQDLKFAMNGGMFIENNIPKGLYIENYKTLHPIDTLDGEGNFYLKPNGIFYMKRSNESAIISTEHFKTDSDIRFATQSGPMLLINGKINPIFQKNSGNLNIRNGVGILKNGDPIFVMSKKKINFYHFASFFKSLGCNEALYFDGFVSRAYFPEENWIQEDGDFGVMIGITTAK